MDDSPEKEPEVVERREPEAPKIVYNRTLRRRATVRPVPEVKKVPSEVRHVHALRRKAAVEPGIEERRKRQRKSKQEIKSAVIKPTPGHQSIRPNRHANKWGKTDRYDNAK